uniref:Uncharacterized protein n=1 Tax=Cuerna arida TaxID=1464854 RepID=A0A1B6G662_9HEMI
MVPKEFRKSLCIAAGWITLVEALVWVAIGIYSIGEYGCTWDFFSTDKGASTGTLLYITYFMGECRGTTSALGLGFNIQPPTESARILNIWIWAFAVTSAVWIPASILLIVAAMGEVRGRTAAALYRPWITLSGALVILDLAGGIFHLVSLFKTRTPDDFAEFVGSTSWQELTMLPSSGVTTWLPSLYVTLLFTRVLIIWLLNIYLVYGVFRASSAVGLYTTKYVESPLTITEKKKTWKDRFYQGPDPALFERPTRRSMVTTSSTSNQQSADIRPASEQVRPGSLAESEPAKSEPASAPTHDQKHDLSPNRYREDEFGIPIEELDMTEPNETGNTQKKNTFPRSPYPPTGRVYDYTGRPVKPESVPDKWQDSPPPMASGVQVPPELNKFEPFSYMAGDQPQFIKRQLSRSSSRPEKPPLIPRPDYTIVDRHPASLEYIPNRFKVPSPKRPLPSQSSFTYEGGQRSPTTPKVAPVPPRKPIVYPRSSKPPISENPAQARYLPQQAVPSQQQAYFTRQTSQGNNYNINKLY